MLFDSWKHPLFGRGRCALAVALGVLLTQAVASAAEPANGNATPDTTETKPATQAAQGAETTQGAEKASRPDKPFGPVILPPFIERTPKVTEEQERTFKSKRSKIQNMLRNGVKPNEEQEFRQYYFDYALARWTYLDRQEEVAGYRRTLKNELIMAGKANKGSHAKLLKLTLDFMTVILRKDLNFAPTVKVNAMLMIGDLNLTESARSRDNPVPLPAARRLLVAAATDPGQIDGVKLAALIGLRRHCTLMVEAGQAPDNSMIGVFVQLARMKEPDRVRSEEGHAWLRTLAVFALGEMKGATNPGAVVQIFRNIIDEQDSPEYLRYAAASALADLNCQRAAGVDVDATLGSLGLLAVDICDTERQRLRDEMESKRQTNTSGYGGGYEGSGYEEMGSGGYEEMDAGGYEEMGGYGYGMAGGATTTKQDRQIERARRRLQEGLGAVVTGMGRRSKVQRRNEAAYGLLAVPGTDAAKVEKFSTPIHEFFVVIDEKVDDLQIEAKPLDEAIAEVREELVTALAQVGVTAPESPEFDPLPEAKPAGAYGASGYEEYSGP